MLPRSKSFTDEGILTSKWWWEENDIKLYLNLIIALHCIASKFQWFSSAIPVATEIESVIFVRPCNHIFVEYSIYYISVWFDQVVPCNSMKMEHERIKVHCFLHNHIYNFDFWPLSSSPFGLAQRKRVGLITQRSKDRNLDSKHEKIFFCQFWHKWLPQPTGCANEIMTVSAIAIQMENSKIWSMSLYVAFYVVACAIMIDQTKCVHVCVKCASRSSSSSVAVTIPPARAGDACGSRRHKRNLNGDDSIVVPPLVSVSKIPSVTQLCGIPSGAVIAIRPSTGVGVATGRRRASLSGIRTMTWIIESWSFLFAIRRWRWPRQMNWRIRP